MFAKSVIVEVMNAYLDHIENLNPKVNAIVALQERAGLLAQARERDAQVARGESMGPLHGFPHAVKDMQPVKGIRSTSGSPILRDFVPTADSLMVERLRKVGAIIIGKTNTSEFGLGSHTYNPVYGATRNAYDQSRSAGGSSGGAAVALALRMLPVADGSDYGGSLRNPAGWNNELRPGSKGCARRLAAVDECSRSYGEKRSRFGDVAFGSGWVRSARPTRDRGGWGDISTPTGTEFQRHTRRHGPATSAAIRRMSQKSSLFAGTR